MTTNAGDEADCRRHATALAYVCGHLAEMREMLGEQGEALLGRLEGALEDDAAEQDLAAVLDELHRALQRAGDAPGVYGYRLPFNAAGLSSLQIVYRCPLRRCAGFSRAEVTEFPPHCAISGGELLRERLV
ncbi:hypothetical protein GCM10023084_71370 [Streptomyces lacrimifluminis]|uniref:Uncharacterized protein n=1 Tax=Streptomyces lacrimifluminis TaxID=1500077 RepID=A0A917PAT1_9ACTN|nr:hypothetical protein [Streptomyces lacrimifluminis]GGJ69007.1 hypothetical protein GCM10012282_77420 [Streptomyces lacrimifluminis]